MWFCNSNSSHRFESIISSWNSNSNISLRFLNFFYDFLFPNIFFSKFCFVHFRFFTFTLPLLRWISNFQILYFLCNLCNLLVNINRCTFMENLLPEIAKYYYVSLIWVLKNQIFSFPPTSKSHFIIAVIFFRLCFALWIFQVSPCLPKNFRTAAIPQ